jgi:predicted RNA-binding protein with PUA-like domain
LIFRLTSLRQGYGGPPKQCEGGSVAREGGRRKPQTRGPDGVCCGVFSPSSRGRLTDRDLGRFPDDTLFHRLARAVCHAGCLPRKELYEAWEVARRVRRLFRGGRVIDLGAGHGLLAQAMLILDDSSPAALVVDKVLPPSSVRLHEVLVQAWPRLAGRVAFIAGALNDVEIRGTDVVVSSHACGRLTDLVLDRAAAARARVAVLPCCHDLATCDAGELSGWVDGPVAIDIMRAMRLEQQGYRIWTQAIPAEITPKNRLLLGRTIDMPRRHWLMKCEPAAYTIDDLARDGRTSWEGVRNYQARNFMRDEMQEGDGVLFYASNADPSGVTGLAEIVRGGYPDRFAWKKGHKYFDAATDEAAPVWYMVDVAFVERFAATVSLDMLKATKGLEQMMVTRKGSRLSVQPVTKQEYDIVARLGRRA